MLAAVFYLATSSASANDSTSNNSIRIKQCIETSIEELETNKIEQILSILKSAKDTSSVNESNFIQPIKEFEDELNKRMKQIKAPSTDEKKIISDIEPPKNDNKKNVKTTQPDTIKNITPTDK